MGTTTYGGKGSKGRAANGDRPVGAGSCRREQYTMATCQNPHTHRLQTAIQPGIVSNPRNTRGTMGK